MKNSAFIFGSVLFCLSTFVNAADIENGKRLHDEHCLECHGSEIYTRDNSLVNSLDELKQRIRQCELANDLAWFEEDVEDVAAYLNATFYLFDKE